MEFTTQNTSPEELAEALRGCHGKKVERDAAFVYIGQAVIGIGKSTYILDKSVGVAHGPWHQLGSDTFIAILR